MRAGRGELKVLLEGGGVSVRSVPLDGMLASLVELPAGADLSRMFEGLPDDLCPAPRWGYVLEGSIHVRQGDGSEETVQAGEVFHWPAGHTAWTTEDVRFFEVSPEREMVEVIDHINSRSAS